MKQFEVGKKYKFDMAMKQEFFDAHSCNEEVFYDLEQFDYEITVSYIEGDTVHYKGDYVLYQTDIKFFFLVVDVPVQKENVVSTKSESEIVKAWLEKLRFVMITDTIVHQQLYIGQEDLILSTDFADIHGAGKVAEFVSYRYDIMQKEIAKANKQSLLDKKAALELELAQINEQLGGVMYD